MNIKHLFLGLLGLAYLTSCSSDSDVQPTSSSRATESTAILALEVAAQYNSKSSEATSGEGSRAMSFDTTDPNVPPFIDESGITSWKTHCFIRNAAGNVQFYAEVDWNVVSNGGSLELTMKGHELTLFSSGGSDPASQAPRAGEIWYISGMTGDGTLNADRTKVDYRPVAADASLPKNQLRVPLSFGWKPFKVKGNGERAPKISVIFRPQGTLLKVVINNATNRGKAVMDSRATIYTNALTNDGAFDFSPSSTPVEERQPSFDFGTNTTAVYTYFTRGENIAKDAKETIIMWGYPRPASQKPAEGWFTDVYIPRYRALAMGQTTFLEPRTRGFSNGRSATFKLDIDRPRMPLEYMAEYNMNAAGDGFVDSNEAGVANLGYFKRYDAIAKFTSITLDGYKYHLPKPEELVSMLSGSSETPRVDLSETKVFTKTKTHEIDGYSVSEEVEFRTIGDKKTLYVYYAKPNDLGRQRVMRMTILSDIANPLKNKLELICRYVGPDFSGTVNDLETSVDWTNLDAVDVVKREIPLAGYYYSDEVTLSSKTIRAILWTTTDAMFDAGNPYDGRYYVLQHVAHSNYPINVRLFLDDYELLKKQRAGH